MRPCIFETFSEETPPAYPEQQLPGVPHEFGVPQQPPEPGSPNPRDELLDIL